ncbi:hypothetical protein SORDD24_00341 [Streptococcus oralis]|uniref:Uncharacterized protein n=1 Tax=Streptococcus oralis TaxID=1303 RepID=A0A139QUG1_STROR|nr:hypothetical protein SORDD24_00341 [Streptococcus oralis]
MFYKYHIAFMVMEITLSGILISFERTFLHDKNIIGYLVYLRY